MNYRSIIDLNNDVVSWSKNLPQDFDLIVGIPRSGLLVANLLSLHLHLPFTEVDGLIEGRVFGSGDRHKATPDLTGHRVPLRVLVVDDSVFSGREMTRTKEHIARANLPHSIQYGAIYMQPNSEHFVDYYYERLPVPRVFEWNVMHHSFLSNSCIDIDGVLCRDPTEEENDDGTRYLEFLRNVEPRFIPSREFGTLVTCRLEKYRDVTEQWLSSHYIRYKKLVMLDLPDAATRRATNPYANYKASVYQETGACLFIESSRRQAVEIANKSLGPVFCTETREMIYPGADHCSNSRPHLHYRLMRKIRGRYHSLKRRIGSAIQRVGNVASRL